MLLKSTVYISRLLLPAISRSLTSTAIRLFTPLSQLDLNHLTTAAHSTLVSRPEAYGAWIWKSMSLSSVGLLYFHKAEQRFLRGRPSVWRGLTSTKRFPIFNRYFSNASAVIGDGQSWMANRKRFLRNLYSSYRNRLANSLDFLFGYRPNRVVNYVD